MNEIYILPEIYDPTNDTFTLIFMNLPSFATYNINNNSIVFWKANIKEDDCKEYVIDIEIEDVRGGFS